MTTRYLLDRVQTELDGEAANLIVAARQVQEIYDCLPALQEMNISRIVEERLGKYVAVSQQPDYQN